MRSLQLRAGAKAVAPRICSRLVYAELRALAARRLAHESPRQTLQPRRLVQTKPGFGSLAARARDGRAAIVSAPPLRKRCGASSESITRSARNRVRHGKGIEPD